MSTLTAEAERHAQPITTRYSLRTVERSWGLLFISPWIIGFILFVAFPMVASLYLSFTDFDLSKNATPNWVGLDNYTQMFGLEFKTISGPTQDTSKLYDPGYAELGRIGNIAIGAHDPLFWKSLKVTLLYAVIALPTSLFVALGLALLTNLRLPFMTVFRTIFYVPYVLPAVASAVIFLQMLNRDIGWVNIIPRSLGLPAPDWLNNEQLVLPGLAMLALWGVGNAMIIYLAGLQGVPTELYEAARVDGANPFVCMVRITLPMISPVILYNLVIGLITTFQYFTQAYVLTQGRGTPNYAAYFFNMHLYNEAFVYGKMGYASAMSWFLLVLVVAITAFVFATSGKWVFYAGGRRS
ncbi:MAG: sugar ABC transporter permease [Chloroflexota bacterium]